MRFYATPRRLSLQIVGLPQAARRICAKNAKALASARLRRRSERFLKSAGLASLDQATIEKDPKKGEFYVAAIERQGSNTLDRLAQILPKS